MNFSNSFMVTSSLPGPFLGTFGWEAYLLRSSWNSLSMSFCFSSSVSALSFLEPPPPPPPLSSPSPSPSPSSSGPLAFSSSPLLLFLFISLVRALISRLISSRFLSCAFSSSSSSSPSATKSSSGGFSFFFFSTLSSFTFFSLFLTLSALTTSGSALPGCSSSSSSGGSSRLYSLPTSEDNLGSSRMSWEDFPLDEANSLLALSRSSSSSSASSPKLRREKSLVAFMLLCGRRSFFPSLSMVMVRRGSTSGKGLLITLVFRMRLGVSGRSFGPTSPSCRRIML